MLRQCSAGFICLELSSSNKPRTLGAYVIRHLESSTRERAMKLYSRTTREGGKGADLRRNQDTARFTGTPTRFGGPAHASKQRPDRSYERSRTVDILTWAGPLRERVSVVGERAILVRRGSPLSRASTGWAARIFAGPTGCRIEPTSMTFSSGPSFPLGALPKARSRWLAFGF